jgi:hypothetical protein
MKKNFLIALVALLAVALNGNAQNNTYNMVIEMANGTKITIGPNDVKNISFNNGELVMTGEDINTLVEQQNKMQVSIDSLAEEDDKHYQEGMALSYYLKDRIECVEVEVAILQGGGGTPDLSDYVTKPELQIALEGTTKEIYNNRDMIGELFERIKALEALVSTFKNCQCNK